jgi:hypothetical protein
LIGYKVKICKGCANSNSPGSRKKNYRFFRRTNTSKNNLDIAKDKLEFSFYKDDAMISGTVPGSSTPSPKTSFNAISSTAFTAGTLLLVSIMAKAYLDMGKQGPLILLKYIASGIFGEQALAGGLLMITWGLVIHYFISFLISTLLFLLYPRMLTFTSKKIMTGIVYGMSAWIVMDLLILPISQVPYHEVFVSKAPSLFFLSHIFAFGIPVAWMAHKYYINRDKVPTQSGASSTATEK